MTTVATSIEDRVKTIIRQQLLVNGINRDEIGSDAKLVVGLGFDSLDVVEATIGLEDEFGIEIDDEVMWEFTTVQSVIDCVTKEVLP
jgi:acyl carrier protein